MTSKDLPIEVFADGADVAEMVRVYRSGAARGFTTNPNFLLQAGVTDYERFIKDVIKAIPDRSLSFEVLSDDLPAMEREARNIAAWSPNIFVKIPIINTRGESTAPLIKRLSRDGMKLNVTVIFSFAQAKIAAESLSPDMDSIISIFAGKDRRHRCRSDAHHREGGGVAQVDPAAQSEDPVGRHAGGFQRHSGHRMRLHNHHHGM